MPALLVPSLEMPKRCLNWKGNAMQFNRWNYSGDVSIRHGGMYWRDDNVSDDQVHLVEVSPLSDEGGPDNLFRVRVGMLHIPDNAETLEKAHSVTGSDPATASREETVLAMRSWQDMDADEVFVLRIGTPDQFWSGREENNPEPVVVLRSDASLRNWIKREYLHPEPSPEPAPKM